ncbi:MAG: transglutaminase [Clostridiales bacterium]|nr:transglutaminase [Clostridiales bacterium]
MKGELKKRKLIIELTVGLGLLIFIGMIAVLQYKSKVVKALTIEAGTPMAMLEVEKFLTNEDETGIFVTDMNSLDLKNPGTHEIQIKIGDKIYNSSLEIIDTMAPLATPVDQVVVKGETIEAEEFATNIMDATPVTVSFKEIPDVTVAGDKEVIIVLRDTSGNYSELKAKLSVLELQPVTVEAGTNPMLTTKDFLSEDDYRVTFETDLSKLDLSKPTTHDILLNVNGKGVNAQINVVDTTPPSARVVSQEIWNDETIEAASFVTEIMDVSEVKVSYKTLPDFTLLGDQSVILILEDESGNQAELTAQLTVKEDTEPPVILGVRDKLVYIGDALSYREGILVTDNKDENVKLQINSSSVNLKREGTYEVKYTATDLAGNTAVKTATITVKKFVVTDEMLNELADGILAKITKDTMTKRDVAYAIYKWVKGHVSYTGSSDKSDWKAEAYRGIKNGLGDCFTYYAVSEALLTRAGIDNMRVTRVGGKTQHFWNLINCGDGWYHFDTCPNRDRMDTFMMTDAKVAEYTEYRGNNYYNFDHSLYPATPEN